MLTDIFSPSSIISLDDIVLTFVSFLFVSLQGLLIYFTKRILSEQEALKNVVQSTAIKMAQLDTDVRYIASEISLLSNNNSNGPVRIRCRSSSAATGGRKWNAVSSTDASAVAVAATRIWDTRVHAGATICHESSCRRTSIRV
jgi:hypothetical protein